MPRTAAEEAKAQQYLFRAGWDRRAPVTPDLKEKAYQLSRVDKASF
jgi:hypothetical protein